MAARDLAELISFAGRFGPGGDPAGDASGDIGFHQGHVAAWNPNNGENTINVAGGQINDVPVLSTTDASMIMPGDQVGIIRFKSTYFILGRIVPPGTERRSQFAYQRVVENGWRVPLDWTDFASTSLPVPQWATTAIVTGTTQGRVNNTSGGLDNIQAFVSIAGSGGGYPQAVEDTYWQNMTYARSRLVTNLDQINDIGVSIRGRAQTREWPAHTDNSVELTVTAIFGN